MANQPSASQPAPTAEMPVELFRGRASEIQTEVSRVIVGQGDVIRDVLIAVLAGGHALLEGVPGLGKTMLVRTLADVLDLSFGRVQFTPDLMPADITGTEIMDEDEDGRRSFRFQRGPLFANLVLADEINRATPKTQSALLEAMQERTVTSGTISHPLPRPFFVLATQNPIEQEGTYPLPEAQLDRFLYKINVGYPTAVELSEILDRTTGATTAEVRTVAGAADLIAMQQVVLDVPMPTDVRDYASRLVVASHPGDSPSPLVNRLLRYGSSPRGAQALVLGAKTVALLDGRANASFEDVDSVSGAALRHRLLLNFEGQAEGASTDEVIADLVSAVPY